MNSFQIDVLSNDLMELCSLGCLVHRSLFKKAVVTILHPSLPRVPSPPFLNKLSQILTLVRQINTCPFPTVLPTYKYLYLIHKIHP